MFCWCATLSCQRASAYWTTKAMWWAPQSWLPGMWVWILLLMWGEKLLAGFVQSYCEFWSDKCLFVQALMETSLTRVVLPMPVLLLPPLIMAMLERSEECLWIWHFRLELFLLQHHTVYLRNHTNVHLVYLMWSQLFMFQSYNLKMYQILKIWQWCI